MISYIIVCRNPRSRKLMVISNEGGDPEEFETEETAFEAAQSTTVCKAWGAEILPLDRP